MCVSHCQLERYCAWAGKRLCTANSNATASTITREAYAACSRDGEYYFPYGDTLSYATCNDYFGFGVPVEVGSFPGCEGGYAGLFDLAGNVQEWTDSCLSSDGATDPCGVFGKDYTDHNPGCGDTWLRQRGEVEPNTGFRCCADEISD